MQEKLTLEQFREIKHQLETLIAQGDELYRQHKNDKNYNFESDEERIIKQYVEVQNKLLSYDLSNIPSTEWMNIEFITDEDHLADFSKTKANIDFSIFQYSPYINYKSCKIQNIDSINYIINSEQFDPDIITNNPSLFLSESFPSSIKQKIYDKTLTIADLTSLSDEQLKELQSKKFFNCVHYLTRSLINVIGLDKALQLYATSKENYQVVETINNILSNYIEDPFTKMDLNEKLQNADVSQIKGIFYSYLRNIILQGRHINIESLPKLFIKENNDILLVGENIPEDLRQRYYYKMLTGDDIINNISIFKNIPIINFTVDFNMKQLAQAFGEDKIHKYLEAYPELFNYIIKSQLTHDFCNFVMENELNINETENIKQQLQNYFKPFFDRNNRLGSGGKEQLLAYETSLFPLEENQQRVIDTLNLDNIKRFEQETGFFSRNNTTNLQMFEAVVNYFRMHAPSKLSEIGIDFQNGTLSYEDFLNVFAKCLDYMKKCNLFNDYPIYDFIKGDFRKNHPEIFIDENAPEKLKYAYYKNKITPEFLFQNKEYIPYLIDKNLLNTIKADIKLCVPSLINEHQGQIIPKNLNFIQEYVSRYGNEKLLQLIAKYGILLSDITITSFHNDIDNEEAIEKAIQKAIHDKIINSRVQISYGYLTTCKDFTSNYPELFVNFDHLEKASLEERQRLETAFYNHDLTYDAIKKNPELANMLKDKNLFSAFKFKSSKELELLKKLGNEKFLQLCSKYGRYMNGMTTLLEQEINIEDEKLSFEDISKTIETIIERECLAGKMTYQPEYAPEFLKERHPELFVNFDHLENTSLEERQRLETAFYNHALTYNDIKINPKLADMLKDKNLFLAFTNFKLNSSKELELLKKLGNENFLQLCVKYGRYMDGIAEHLNKDITIRNEKYLDFANDSLDGLSVDDISKRMEDIIIRESKLGNIAYRPDDAPSFLKESHPELFLGEDAPEELKRFFYNYGNNYPMSFEVLQKHKEWLPFLKDKALTASLLRNNYLKKELMQYLELFGEEKGIKLGINRAETVKEMMKSHQIELMKNWYDKTGGKFIPDFVVMQNFRLEEADKFLTSGSNWSNLMKIKSFAQTPEARDAMLKLAYSFGAFDQDQRGFKKLQDLLTSLPKKIDSEQAYIFDQIDQQINLYSQKEVFFNVKTRTYIDSEGNVHITNESSPSSNFGESYQKMIEHIKNNVFTDLLDNKSLLNLLESLKQENVGIDFSKNIFTQIYRKNEDGSYTLTMNAQSCPKSAQAIRSVLEKFRGVPILTPEKAHQLFGGFELKYDSDFREFLLTNMDKIMANPEYVSLVASVQRQFSDIKAINSNRVLTWELAVSYVQTNKYTSINVGNEKVAEISAIAGYSQADFNTLQQIYNYGKQRTFSSIPRIEQNSEKTSGKYTYETLRLDDPLAMAIGTLTDCCQELNNCAEVCMEHSMVDKNGRVFVIKDEQGNIVAQSWVWRNKDVLCFDNIEIPDKAFARAIKEHPELGRKGFTDEVFEIYKQAAQDLIKADEKVYKELLESGKITQEQYDGLRLGKITVGLGYNDIAESLKQNSTVDKGIVSRPLPFEEPVKLSRGLYTRDSTTQYILEERDDRKEFDGDTLPVHSDAFVEYSDSNFTEKSLLSLEKLEIVTKEDPRNLDTSVSEYADSKHLVTEIARNYGLNPETAKIIMNPNFAIIYDVNGDKLRIGDLLFNTKVDNEHQQMDMENQVVMQMRLALEQITNDKEIDVSSLNEKQKEIYSKITGLTNEMDIERGVGHAR